MCLFFFFSLSQKGTEAVLKFHVAGRLRARVLGGHFAEGLWVRPWVGARAVVVGVTVSQHFQFLAVGAIPDAEILVRVTFPNNSSFPGAAASAGWSWWAPEVSGAEVPTARWVA